MTDVTDQGATQPEATTQGRKRGLTLRIAAKREIAQDIHFFDLQAGDGGELPAFTAGAHIPVRIPNGRMRSYSLCNDPAERHRYCLAVKRDGNGRGGSMNLIDATAVGDTLTIAPPRNLFPLEGNAASYIFIAGGIGITPIRSMIAHLMATRAKPFKLFYFTRSPEQMAFRDEFATPAFHGKVIMHHDGGDPAKAFDLWPVLENPKAAHIYCCGPRGLMDAVRDMSGHWPSSAVHFEDFGAGITPVKAATDGAFTVKLAKSGQTLSVPPGKSILEVVRAAGIDAASSCESGTCGTCRCGLLSGEVDHRDMVLADHERATAIMICVSRAKAGELVLDL
jgi:phthalate 4,5-dioxygenase reductase component